jgi:hypothetical protein
MGEDEVVVTQSVTGWEDPNPPVFPEKSTWLNPDCLKGRKPAGRGLSPEGFVLRKC